MGSINEEKASWAARAQRFIRHRTRQRLYKPCGRCSFHISITVPSLFYGDLVPETLEPCSGVLNNPFSITVPSIFSGYPPHILMTVPLYFTADRDRPLDLPRPPWHLVTLSHTYTLESTLPPKTRDSTYHNKMIYDYDVARTAEVGAAVRQTPSTHPLGIL